MAPIPVPSGISLSHFLVIVTAIALTFEVFTVLLFLLSNRDCPFSVGGPITGTLSRPLNVLCVLTRLTEVGESFEAPFKLV